MKHWEYVNNNLHFGVQSFNLVELFNKYEGPTYVYDLKMIENRFNLYNEYFPNQVHYAVKANYNSMILSCLRRQGSGVDVVSWGESVQALETGFKPQDIIFSGIGKTIEELNLAVNSKIKQINVESLSEIRRISKIVDEKKIITNISMRINPDVDVKTHPYIATGLLENKFGIDVEQISEATELIRKSQYLNLVGLSMHIGSQLTELKGFQEGLKKLVKIFNSLRVLFPNMKRIDVGGGLGIKYEKVDLEAEEMLLKKYSQIVYKEIKNLEIEVLTEPGRWIVGHAGVLVSQIQYIKSNKKKKFIILDSGMNHLLRPSLYNAYHEILPLQLKLISSDTKAKISKDTKAKTSKLKDTKIKNKSVKSDLSSGLLKPGDVTKYDVVGPICETGDFFARNRKLPIVSEGDLVAILDVGAYGYSMSNNYNLRPVAKEIFI